MKITSLGPSTDLRDLTIKHSLSDLYQSGFRRVVETRTLVEKNKVDQEMEKMNLHMCL